MRRLTGRRSVTPPIYTDGKFDLYVLKEERVGNYPRLVPHALRQSIWYRETGVYDRTRAALEAVGKTITMKVRIPRTDTIDSTHLCLIDGRFHEIYNAAGVYDRNGFPETELTLIAPDKNITEWEARK